MHFARCASVVAPLVLPGIVVADALGGLDGRSADPSSLPTLSAEVAYVRDDEVSVLGLRANYKVDGTTTAFVTAALTEFDDSGADGYLFGAGLYYHFARQRISEAVDIAIKPSVGYQSAEGGGAEVSGSVAALEVLVSGVRPLAGRVGWYANAGAEFSYIDTNNNGNDGDFDGLIGAGVHTDLGPGQIYAGIDYSGELGYGAGYRYHF